MDALSSLPPIADPTFNSGLSALSMKLGNAGQGDAAIDKAAHDFEAVFATQMLQPMFEGLQADPMFGGGHGEEIMRSFMLQEYGKLIAKSGKLGIASQVKAEMLKVQEGASARKDTRIAKNPYAATAAAGAPNVARQ